MGSAPFMKKAAPFAGAGAGVGLSAEDQFYKDMLAQQQAAESAAAAVKQQQLAQEKEMLQMQLQQAWAIAQQNLAQAQKEMAASIGMQPSQLQGQMWGQALPYALPKGTSVAPGFEYGGPMQQLYKMGGSQFTPGQTGRISPYPQPSQSQIMQWVSNAMKQYGPGG